VNRAQAVAGNGPDNESRYTPRGGEANSMSDNTSGERAMQAPCANVSSTGGPSQCEQREQDGGNAENVAAPATDSATRPAPAPRAGAEGDAEGARLNINAQVAFRLTDRGRFAREEFLRRIGLPASYPMWQADADGTVTAPLWEVMQVLGPHTMMGAANTIDRNEIVVLPDPLTAALRAAAPAPREAAGEAERDAARYRVLRDIALGDDIDAWTRWYFLLDYAMDDPEAGFYAEAQFDRAVDTVTPSAAAPARAGAEGGGEVLPGVPRAKGLDAATETGGWTIDPAYLERIADAAEKHDDGPVMWETVQAVLLAYAEVSRG
jgi:hypothetical protein